LIYEKPSITVLGSIASHTWTTPGGVGIKGGGDVWHYDKFCEASGGSDPDKRSDCGPPPTK
jgi:hypothetical protein